MWLSRASEPYIIDQQDDDGASNRIPIFVTKVADILLRVVEKGDCRLTAELVDLLPDTLFKIKVFNRNV